MSDNMFDLIRFSPSDPSASAHLVAGDLSASPRLVADVPSASVHLVDVRTIPPSIFSTVPDIERARVIIKRCRFIHMPIWYPDVGLARLFKEHNAVMVIGISDLLPLPPAELAKRLARAAHMASMVLHFGGQVRLASMARNEMELRNPLELMCIGSRLGISSGIISKGLQAPLEV